MNIASIFRTRSQLRQLKLSPIAYRYQFFSVNTDEKFEIPKRIPRGPTDILRALESTISRDPTAPHYKYHDDPYLIPMSNVAKRSMAMAQEAGRKAAQWIKQEHAELFQHKEADPPIEAFFPRIVYNEQSEVSEKDLISVIDTIQVSDAVLIYKLLKNNGIEITPETQQSLLELLCYYNNEDALSEEFIEERWFRQSSRSKERSRKSWNDGSTAEEIFNNMSPQTPESYAAIIQGMAKYCQVDRAWQLFEESQQKGHTLNTETFNALLSVASFLKEGYDLRWNLMVNLLTDMNKAQLKPNLGTLNAVLFTLSTMGTGKATREFVLSTLKEFKEVGIEPSLASWYYVLITFCKDRGPISTILNDIMIEIENKEHTIQDKNDTNFFVTAMDICRNHLRDLELAKRVDKLLHYGNNYNLIGDSYKESIYYRHYFNLLCTSLPIDEFMNNTYNKLVPHIYVPEPAVMEEVVRQIDINGAVSFVPQLWSDMIIFDHTKRETLLNLLLDTMINNPQPAENDLCKQFSAIGWDIYERINNQNEQRFNKVTFTGELLGKIMLLVLRGNEFEKACTVMDKLDKEHSNIVGIPKFEALSLFIDHCIEEKLPTRAINCIQYCNDSGFPETADLAQKLNENLTLDENYLDRLTKIVGDVALRNKSTEK